MIPFDKAYEIVIKALKAIAGKATPKPKPDNTLKELGIYNNENISDLKNQIVGALANEGYEFQKMSLNKINPSTKVGELANLVSYAIPTTNQRFY